MSKRRSYLFDWLLEYALMILHFPLGILNFFLDFSPLRKEHTPTVILVERWLKRNPLHYVMKKYLEKSGFVVHSINFNMLKGSFEDSASELAAFVKKEGIENAALVGISNGGITCLRYIDLYDMWKKIPIFIAIGSPFGGAQMWNFLPESIVKTELNPEGEYVKKIQSTPIKYPKKMVVIAARYDQMVGHKNTLHGSVRNIIIDVAGHNYVHTLSKNALKKVGGILEKAFTH